MNQFHKSISVALTVFLLFFMMSFHASAQRTSDRQFHVTASAGGSVAGALGAAADFSFGQYILSSRWDAGVSYGCRNGYADPYHTIIVQGTWLRRIYGTSNRAFSMYCGGGLRTGVDFGLVPDSDKTGSSSGSPSVDDGGVSWFPDSGKDKDPSASVLYGFHFVYDMEVFVSDRVALIGDFRVPLNFNSLGPICCPEVLIGLRFNL